ncbi:MAG: hypothetical protein JWM53_4955 [bacterium]|nr:hypothetical protein [bacterium]
MRALLRAGAVAVGSVVAVGPLAACNYKGCGYDTNICRGFDRPDGGIPDLGGTDLSAAPPADLAGAPDDGGEGHD